MHTNRDGMLMLLESLICSGPVKSYHLKLLILPFKPALYSSTLVIKLFTVVLSRNSYCNTIGQSSLISFATRMARPLLKLKHSLQFPLDPPMQSAICALNNLNLWNNNHIIESTYYTHVYNKYVCTTFKWCFEINTAYIPIV